MPCIDASAGHICSYPYFTIVFTTELNSLYYYGEINQGIDALDKLYGKRDYKLMDLKDDGTKEILIEFSKNEVYFQEFKIKTLTIKFISYFD